MSRHRKLKVCRYCRELHVVVYFWSVSLKREEGNEVGMLGMGQSITHFVGHAADFLSYSIEEIAIKEIFAGILFVKDHYKTSFLICKMIIVEIIVLWVMWVRDNMLSTLQSKY